MFVLENSPYRLPGHDLEGPRLSTTAILGLLKAPSVPARLPISFPPVIESTACDQCVQLSLSFPLWRQEWECEQGVTSADGPNIHSCGVGPGGGQRGRTFPEDAWDPNSTRRVVSRRSWGSLLFCSLTLPLGNQGAAGAQVSCPQDTKDRASFALLSSHKMNPGPRLQGTADMFGHLPVFWWTSVFKPDPNHSQTWRMGCQSALPTQTQQCNQVPGAAI